MRLSFTHMSRFFLMISSLPLLHLAWWWWTDRRLVVLPRPRLWRGALAAFALLWLVLYVWLFSGRLLGNAAPIPTPLLGSLYLWFIVVLPGTIVLLGGHALTHALWRGFRAIRLALGGVVQSAHKTLADEHAAGVALAAVPATDAHDPGMTRRRLLAATAAAIPPLALAGSDLTALVQLQGFRTRRFELAFPNLPSALDGFTIAHVSDIHVGKFTRGAMLERIAAQTNDFDADLVCVTGDLIDFDLRDLPDATEAVRAMRGRHGILVCEGNHDLFASRDEFELGVRRAGLRMLLNEQATIDVRGTPLQLLGVRWGEPGVGRGPFIRGNMERVTPLVREDAFRILLAHHPEAFDDAADAGIELTLAGHTHGGQLMLTPEIGPGALLFKYVSGLYTRGAQQLVVSNGVGNWFPLRINAPAELVHITLKRTPTT